MNKRTILIAAAMLALLSAGNAAAQNFGGHQVEAPKLDCSQIFKDIDYAGDEEVYHLLDIYLPAEKKDSYPVIIHIYGSAWMSNNSKNMADLGTIVKSLLDAGYAVVTPNHRSSSDAHFPAQINDIKAVVRFLKANAEKYSLDTSFIGASGFSSGAHLASLLATSGNVAALEGNVGGNLKYSSSVDAACEWSGPIDLLNMDCAGPQNWNPSPEELLIGVPVEGNKEKYDAINPISYIDPADPPVMIFHGVKDKVVPACQAPEFFEALDNAGVDARLELVKKGGHGIDMYSAENLAKMVEFFNDARDGRPIVNRFKPLTLEDYFTPSNDVPMSPDAKGFIRRWTILEPIEKPNRSNTVFTDSYLRDAFSTVYFKGQDEVIPADGDKVKVKFTVKEIVGGYRMMGGTPPQEKERLINTKLQWHSLDSKLFNIKLFRFSSGLKKPVYGVIYRVVTVINCEEDLNNVRLSVGSNSASMWTIDGEEAVILSGDRRMVADDCASARLNLSKGKHVLRGTVINGPGMSDFCVRFTDENGVPVTSGYTITNR